MEFLLFPHARCHGFAGVTVICFGAVFCSPLCVWTLCILGYRIMSHSFFNHPVVVKEGVETVSGEGKPLRGTTLMNARSQITTMVNSRVTAGTFGAVGCLGDTDNVMRQRQRQNPSHILFQPATRWTARWSSPARRRNFVHPSTPNPRPIQPSDNGYRAISGDKPAGTHPI